MDPQCSSTGISVSRYLRQAFYKHLHPEKPTRRTIMDGWMNGWTKGGTKADALRIGGAGGDTGMCVGVRVTGILT